MKRLFALLLLIASPAYAGDFPTYMGEGRNGPVASQYTFMSGALLDPATSSPTTIGSVAFGFESRAVRLCLWRDSGTLYFRPTFQVSNVVASMDTNTAPSSSSSAFISGDSGNAQAYGAMVIRATASTSQQGLATNYPPAPRCITIPLRARGITVHVVSGLATVEVTGYK